MLIKLNAEVQSQVGLLHQNSNTETDSGHMQLNCYFVISADVSFL